MNYLLIAFAALVVGLILGRFWPKKKASFDGALEVTGDAKKIFQFEIDVEPEELARKEVIVFKVVRREEAVRN